MTRAPSRKNWRAVSRPMPVVPPVMSARLPASRFMILLLLFVGGHHNYCFAVTKCADWFAGVGSGRVRECNFRVDEDAQALQVEHFGDFNEFLLIRFDDEERLLHTRVIRVFAVSGNGYEATSGFEHIPGTTQRFSADRVEYHVHIPDTLFESISVV